MKQIYPTFTIRLTEEYHVRIFQNICKIILNDNKPKIKESVLLTYIKERKVGDQVFFNDWDYQQGIEYMTFNGVDGKPYPHKGLLLDLDSENGFVDILSYLGREPLDLITFKLKTEIDDASRI